MPYNTSDKRKRCLKRFYDKRRANGLCIRCGKPAALPRRHCEACGQKLSTANCQRLQEWRTKVIQGYGGKCKCCGESIREFLSIDHVAYRACEEKKKLGRYLTTTEICQKILRENFPDTYQILCYNCNMSLGILGYCPHHPEITRPVGHLPMDSNSERLATL